MTEERPAWIRGKLNVVILLNVGFAETWKTELAILLNLIRQFQIRIHLLRIIKHGAIRCWPATIFAVRLRSICVKEFFGLKNIFLLRSLPGWRAS